MDKRTVAALVWQGPVSVWWKQAQHLALHVVQVTCYHQAVQRGPKVHTLQLHQSACSPSLLVRA